MLAVDMLPMAKPSRTLLASKYLIAIDKELQATYQYSLSVKTCHCLYATWSCQDGSHLIFKHTISSYEERGILGWTMDWPE